MRSAFPPPTNQQRLIAQSILVLGLIVQATPSDGKVTQLFLGGGNLDIRGWVPIGANVTAVIGDPGGDLVSGVTWSLNFTGVDCNFNQAFVPTDFRSCPASSGAGGFLTFTATVSYADQPGPCNIPVPGPAPNVLQIMVTIYPPEDFTILPPFDQPQQVSSFQNVSVKFRVRDGLGLDFGGNTMGAVERISFPPPVVPATEWDGNWGPPADDPWVSFGMDDSRTISDRKTLNLVAQENTPAGTVIYQYSQELACVGQDPCGNRPVYSLGSLTVRYTTTNSRFVFVLTLQKNP